VFQRLSFDVCHLTSDLWSPISAFQRFSFQRLILILHRAAFQRFQPVSTIRANSRSRFAAANSDFWGTHLVAGLGSPIRVASFSMSAFQLFNFGL
jgi:hypothetical protein